MVANGDADSSPQSASTCDASSAIPIGDVEDSSPSDVELSPTDSSPVNLADLDDSGEQLTVPVRGSVVPPRTPPVARRNAHRAVNQNAAKRRRRSNTDDHGGADDNDDDHDDDDDDDDDDHHHGGSRKVLPASLRHSSDRLADLSPEMIELSDEELPTTPTVGTDWDRAPLDDDESSSVDQSDDQLDQAFDQMPATQIGSPHMVSSDDGDEGEFEHDRGSTTTTNGAGSVGGRIRSNTTPFELASFLLSPTVNFAQEGGGSGNGDLGVPPRASTSTPPPLTHSHTPTLTRKSAITSNTSDAPPRVVKHVDSTADFQRARPAAAAAAAAAAEAATTAATALTSKKAPTVTSLDSLPMLRVFLTQHERVVQLLRAPLIAKSYVLDEWKETSISQATPEPFGLLRIKLLVTVQALLIRILIVPDNARAAYVQRLADTRIIDACLDVFFAYKWHSIVHNIVEDMVAGMVMLQYPGSDVIHSLLVHRIRLHHRIMHACQLNHQTCLDSPMGTNARLGLMAHTIAMAESLASNSRIMALIAHDESFSKPTWQTIVMPQVSEAKKLRTAGKLARMQQQQQQQQQQK
jgi:hypothetical protein